MTALLRWVAALGLMFPLVCLLIVLAIQFLLFVVAIRAYLGSHESVIWPSTILSGVCLIGSMWLINYFKAIREK